MEKKKLGRLRDLSEQIHQEIYDLYLTGNYTGQSLGRLYNIPGRSIRYMLDRMGAPRKTQSEACRRYPVDDNYFDEIDTPEKAHFFGLLLSDGSNDTDNHTIRLTLQARDKELLEKLNNLIQPTRPLLFQARGEPHHQDYWTLTITSKRISENLSNLGCIKAKSHFIVFPEWLDEKLVPSFLRGLFEGDGHIDINYLSIAGCRAIQERIRQIVQEKLSIPSSIVIKKGYREEDWGVWTITGREKMRNFLNWIYRDAEILMKRKYDTYMELVGWENKNPRLINPDGTVMTHEQKLYRRRVMGNAQRRAAGSVARPRKINRDLKN